MHKMRREICRNVPKSGAGRWKLLTNCTKKIKIEIAAMALEVCI